MEREGGVFMPSKLVSLAFFELRAASTSTRAPRERVVLMTGMARADSRTKLAAFDKSASLIYESDARTQEGVDVLHRLESFLPELQLDSNVQLFETGVKMALQCLRVAQVDGVDLLRILGRILEVVAKQLTKPAEFRLTRVALAEVERLVGSGLVHDFKTRVVLEDVQHGPVSLPEELQPGRDNGTVRPVFGLLTGDGRQQDRLRGLDSLQVAHILQTGLFTFLSLASARNLIGLRLSLLHLLFRKLNEPPENQLDGRNVRVLTRVLVVVQAVLGRLSFPKVHTKFDEKQHHRLKAGDSAVPGPLGGDMFVEDRQRGLLLVNADDIYIRRSHEVRHVLAYWGGGGILGGARGLVGIGFAQAVFKSCFVV
ncbi:Eukaryotic translation initiation factor 3 subunit [Hortaea werneckii]|nr:Eukaryotic translation initiation factor 3 subunit [Hortaea werneckii]